MNLHSTQSLPPRNAIILFAILSSWLSVVAQPITVDGELADWCPNSMLAGPGQANLGHIARDTNGVRTVYLD